jgi:hypothetical protein
MTNYAVHDELWFLEHLKIVWNIEIFNWFINN